MPSQTPPVALDRAAKPSPRAQRECGIELGRIYCCLSVIAVHLFLYGSFDKGNNLLWSFAKCSAVPVFFMITGFYLSLKTPFSVQFSRLLRRVVVPMLALLPLMAQFAPWAFGEATFVECLTRMNVDWAQLGKMVVTCGQLGYVPEYNVAFGHLWFVYALFQCYLLFPVLKLLCADNAAALAAKKYTLVLGLLVFVGIGTAKSVFAGSETIQNLPSVPLTPFYWIWLMLAVQHLSLFLRNEAARNRYRSGLIAGGLALYAIGSLGCYYLTLSGHVEIDPVSGQPFGIDRFYERNFILYLIGNFGAFAFFLGLPITGAVPRKIVLFLADKTFYVYILHWIVMTKVREILPLDRGKAIFDFYLLAITYVICLGLACLLKWLERRLNSLWDSGFAMHNGQTR